MLVCSATNVKHMACISTGKIPIAAISLDVIEQAKAFRDAGTYMTTCDVFTNMMPLWMPRRSIPTAKYPAKGRGPVPHPRVP